MNKHASSKAKAPATTTPPLSRQNTAAQHNDSTSTSSSSTPKVVATPTSTTSLDPEDNESVMDTGQSSGAGDVIKTQTPQDNLVPALEVGKDDAEPELAQTKKKAAKKRKKGKRGSSAKKHRHVKEGSSSDSESSSPDSSISSSDSDSSESSSSEDEKEIKRRKKKTAAKKKLKAKKKEKAKAKAKAKAKKSKKNDPSSDDSGDNSSSSDSDSDSEDEKKQRRKKKEKAKAKKKRSRKHDSSSDDSSSESSFPSGSESDSEDEKKKRRKKKAKKAKKKVEDSPSSSESDSEEEGSAESTPPTSNDSEEDTTTKIQKMTNELAVLKLLQQQEAAGMIPPAATKKEDSPSKKNVKKSNKEYKRVDQVWDSKIRDYKYTESAEEKKDEFDCVFTVRRKFNWENKYDYTLVDIKSKLLRDALQVILKDCKGISLVEDTPSIHPHMLFLYYDELKVYFKKTLKTQLKKAKKKKEKKRLTQQIAHCKLLASYIDEDYEGTRKKLQPMLRAGNIIYDLIWALFKPNTIAFTPTYGNKDDPRCFKVDSSYEEEDFMGNRKVRIDGRYMEYDGKVFGLGDHGVEIASFKGPRKIVSLAAYPLQYHKDPEGVKKQLIERGKKFVALQGMNYRCHKGLAYMKQKRTVARFNINGRVMVDPAIFRRINPNYPLSYIKQDEVGQDDSGSDSDGEDESGSDADSEDCDSEPKRLVVWKDKKGKKHLISIPAGGNADSPTEKLESVEDDDGSQHTFTEEELLIASPVVLGFAFSEKFWLEFSLSGIREIEWNREAFNSLVLPKHIKQNLKGLVSSHRFNAAKTIDDVIQGKGKGLNVVLHGPPGVGKTLTGESIAEYLKCPLYAVSAGELGTNSRSLEMDLNRIMDITHSWGAILLLDEADVFLEARQAHDIHRNSLVSVFLRLLEYYQGILFLTTNRVETFDEAFQSRIHMGIRYENLTSKARKEIWQHHIKKVEQMEGQESKPFREKDIEELSKKVLNGRQIKNNVKTAQSIALAEKEAFGIEHIKRVMEVAEDFEADMKGGLGYRDAMRQYA